MRLLSIFLFLCCSFAVSGQDTIRVYFEYGSSKMSEIEARKLRVLQNDFDLQDVEYAEFIGYADSIGNSSSNVKLSEKRARNAYKYCKDDFAPRADIRILAKGEGVKDNQNENRRVEIILHYPAEIAPPKKDVVHNVDPRCFYIDFDALKYCNIREIKKRGRRFIYIEALPVDLFKERKHYYTIRTRRNGNVSVQRVRWKLKTTGKLWWRKKRWVATIPRASFIQYQFFTLADAPCSGCTEEIFTKDTIIRTRDKLYADYFLMDNMQAKLRVFKQDQVKVRVPKEYVDLEQGYYLGDTTGVVSAYYVRSTVDWTTKKFGKKNQDYYFTKFYLHDSRMPYILQKRKTTECLNAPVWNGGSRRDYWTCGGVRGGSGWALGLMGALEPGVFYHNDTLTGYLAAGITFVNYTYMHIQGGINTHKGFYGAFNFRYPITSFRLKALSIKNKWQNPYEIEKPGYASRFIHLYAGLDTKTSFNRKYQSFFEGNLHLGLSVRPRVLGLYPEFYLQGGASYDFMQRINTNIYPYAQFGIRFYTRGFI